MNMNTPTNITTKRAAALAQRDSLLTVVSAHNCVGSPAARNYRSSAYAPPRHRANGNNANGNAITGE